MMLLGKYFPGLTEKQKEQFEKLPPLYEDWNSKINVISRKDVAELGLHHVLHSLAIARFITLRPGATILDLGTGGGFPGIPLAIVFPETHFVLMDGTGKKIQVVEAIAKDLGLENVIARHGRIEEAHMKVDFVVSRGVASLEQLARWSMPLLKKQGIHAIPNGLIALKGGNLSSEIQELPRHLLCEKHALSNYFSEMYFREKFLLYVQ